MRKSFEAIRAKHLVLDRHSVGGFTNPHRLESFRRGYSPVICESRGSRLLYIGSYLERHAEVRV